MENKKSKKKVLLYYLILAACLLVIAAITVTIVLTVGRNKTPTLSDGHQTEKPDDTNTPNGGNTPDNSNKPGNTPNGGNTPDDGNQPTGGDGSFGLPIANASVSCGYEFTFDKTLDRYAVHQGMDFKGSAGDSVFAVMDGTVTKVVTDHILGENLVTITHANGLTSTYKYINAIEGLAVGDNVKKGDVLGYIAEAKGMEMNEGEHLHFEMSVNGRTVDPDTYLEIIEK